VLILKETRLGLILLVAMTKPLVKWMDKMSIGNKRVAMTAQHIITWANHGRNITINTRVKKLNTK